jgi:hypothetical protein
MPALCETRNLKIYKGFQVWHGFCLGYGERLGVMMFDDVQRVTIAVPGSTRRTGSYCSVHLEVAMSDLVVVLMKRARNCPVACSLKILFFLLLLTALYLAIYHQTSVSLPWYLLFLGVIAVESALMLFANINCRISSGESSD